MSEENRPAEPEELDAYTRETGYWDKYVEV